jgi:predicted transcriptional regulator
MKGAATARLDQSGKYIIPADDPAAPNVIDDAVDEVIEEVLGKQGKVVFVENGALTDHGRIALVLRY